MALRSLYAAAAATYKLYVGYACIKYRPHSSFLSRALTLSTLLPLGSCTHTSIIVSFSTPIIYAFSRHLLYSGCGGCAALEVVVVTQSVFPPLPRPDGPSSNCAFLMAAFLWGQRVLIFCFSHLRAMANGGRTAGAAGEYINRV